MLAAAVEIKEREKRRKEGIGEAPHTHADEERVSSLFLSLPTTDQLTSSSSGRVYAWGSLFHFRFNLVAEEEGGMGKGEATAPKRMRRMKRWMEVVFPSTCVCAREPSISFPVAPFPFRYFPAAAARGLADISESTLSSWGGRGEGAGSAERSLPHPPSLSLLSPNRKSESESSLFLSLLLPLSLSLSWPLLTNGKSL